MSAVTRRVATEAHLLRKNRLLQRLPGRNSSVFKHTQKKFVVRLALTTAGQMHINNRSQHKAAVNLMRELV